MTDSSFSLRGCRISILGKVPDAPLDVKYFRILLVSHQLALARKLFIDEWRSSQVHKVFVEVSVSHQWRERSR